MLGENFGVFLGDEVVYVVFLLSVGLRWAVGDPLPRGELEEKHVAEAFEMVLIGYQPSRMARKG